MLWSTVIIFLIQYIGHTIAATNFVSIYSKTLSQLVTSSTLVWQSYIGDPKQLEYAVPAAKFVSKDENYLEFVCRAPIEGIFTSGHTKKHQQRTVCIVSMHMEVRIHDQFDVLLNKGHGGKLIWKPWNKFSASIPPGAVSALSAGHVSILYFIHIYICCLQCI